MLNGHSRGSTGTLLEIGADRTCHGGKQAKIALGLRLMPPRREKGHGFFLVANDGKGRDWA